MRKVIWTIIFVCVISFCCTGVGFAKFSCEVDSVDLETGTLVLKNCKEKGLKRIKKGNTVDITKKRKKVEGC